MTDQLYEAAQAVVLDSAWADETDGLMFVKCELIESLAVALNHADALRTAALVEALAKALFDHDSNLSNLGNPFLTLDVCRAIAGDALRAVLEATDD